VFALCGLALAQPLFDLLGHNATFLVVQDLDGFRLFAFTVAVIVVPPALIVGVLALVRLASKRVEWWAFCAIAGFLFALFLGPAVDRAVDLPDWLWAIAMIGVAVGAGLLADRARAARGFAAYLSPAPIVFAGLFLLVSPAHVLLTDSDPSAIVGSGAATTPVVVLVFDEFPLGAIVDGSGHLDTARFPGFARLARAATWYPNATTVSAETHVAVPAIQTGNVPESREAAPVAAEYPRSLFTMLGRSGPVHAIEDVTHVCPDAICGKRAALGTGTLLSDLEVLVGYNVLPQDLEARWLPSLDGKWADFAHDESSTSRTNGTDSEDAKTYIDALKQQRAATGREDPGELATRWVASIRGPARAGLWYGHFHLPHRSYKRLPDGALYLDPETHPGLNDRWPLTDQLAPFQTTRLLLQVGYADRVVGQLLDRLQRQGLLEQSMVVVVADHGQSLRDPTDVRGLEQMDAENRDDVIPVPLFVKYPGERAGKVDRRIAETIDIMPTIADQLDAQLPDDWTFDGRSLLAKPERDRARTPTFFQDPSPQFMKDANAARSGAWMREQLAPHPGTTATADDFYRLAPYGGIVGANVGALAAGPPVPGARATLSRRDDFEHVSRASGWLPALLRARINHADGEHVAVALNGVVAGVGPMYTDRGHVQAAAMLDDRYLHDGDNTVTLYRVTGDPSAPMLEEIAVRS
jgi:hypothetical protein